MDALGDGVGHEADEKPSASVFTCVLIPSSRVLLNTSTGAAEPVRTTSRSLFVLSLRRASPTQCYRRDARCAAGSRSVVPLVQLAIGRP